MYETDLSITINSKINWGRYKRKKIKDIPIDYLVTQSKNLKTCSDEMLVSFIKKNLTGLKQALLEGKIYIRDVDFSQQNKYLEYVVPNDYKTKKTNTAEKFSEVKCSSGKKGYRSQNDAVQAIKTLKRTSSRDKGNVPKRGYFCDECRKWHLSSIVIWKKSKSPA